MVNWVASHHMTQSAMAATNQSALSSGEMGSVEMKLDMVR